MNQAINVKISALQAACMELTRYMTKANEVFQEILSADSECSKRWEIFQKEQDVRKEVSATEFHDMVSKLGDTQIIEAEVVIR